MDPIVWWGGSVIGAWTGICVLVIEQLISRERWFHPLKFRLKFRMWPGEAKAPERRIKQEIVDNKLGELATNFADACRTEELILSPYQKGDERDSGWNPWEDLKKYQKAHKELLRRKKAFWDAWNLAKDFGFSVKSSVKVYAPFPSSVDEEGRMIPVAPGHKT